MGKRLTTQIFLERIKTRFPEMFYKNDYSQTEFSNIGTKVTVVCKEHGMFQVWPGDHMNGMSGCKKCIQNKRKATLIQKYGVDNIFKRTDIITASMLTKYGVPNPGLLPNHIDKIQETNLRKYGTRWSSHTPDAQKSRKQTNLKKYGTEFPTQNKDIAAKIVETKVKNGGFTKSNSSMEASNFIASYIARNGYDNEQCAYANYDLGLHEWGIYKNGRWTLFDLVVFEKGYRGNKDKIIEILEYYGPFHYTLEEATTFGNKRAYPWKTNKTTVKESYLRDIEKEQIARELTDKYVVIRTRQ